jgi:shikimate kinase
MKALGMASSIGGAVEPSSEFDNVAFDPETLAILEGVFEEAWVSIQAQRNGNITRAALAERILKLAVKGERNPARLLDGALSGSKTDAERDRLEKALEVGLRETFPASDAVACSSAALLEQHKDYTSRSKG